MTLFEIINKLKDIAISKPNINYVGDGDVYTLNSLPNIDYSVFFITQNLRIFIIKEFTVLYQNF